MDIKNMTKLLLITTWLLSIVSLLIVYFSNYIPEVHNAYAIPLAIVVGLSSIAVAISINK